MDLNKEDIALTLEAIKKSLEGNKYKSTHWGSEDNLNKFCHDTFEVNESNFWVTSAVDTSNDLVSFTKMNEQEQDIFIKCSIILQQIDKNQSTDGMMVLSEKATNPAEQMVFAFQAGMEAVHSKSYNRINSTITTTEEEEKYIKWAEENIYVQRIVNFLFDRVKSSSEIPGIPGYLRTLGYSNAVESYVFYSLFYQFLRAARVENRMMKSLEIILLIMRDESVHAGFGGVIFNNYFTLLTQEEERLNIPLEERESEKITKEFMESFTLLHELVTDLIEHLYEPFGEVYKDEVKRYSNYNFNRLFRSLGYQDVFSAEETYVREVIAADLQNVAINSDNFSLVGNAYTMLTFKPLSDNDLDKVKGELSQPLI